MNLFKTKRLLVTLVVAGGCVAAHANYVTNGSFTGGSMAGWTVTGSLGWFPWTGGTAGSSNNNIAYSNLYYDSAYTGANTSAQGTSTMSQVLGGLVAGKTYFLSMDVASSDVPQGATADNAIVAAAVGGNTVLSQVNITAANDQANWMHLSGSFVAGADNTLSITGYDNPSGIFVTHVLVNTPSPAAMSVFGVALVPVFLRRRKKK